MTEAKRKHTRSEAKALLTKLIQDQGFKLKEETTEGGLLFRLINGKGSSVGSIFIPDSQLANGREYFYGKVVEQLGAAAKEPVNKS